MERDYFSRDPPYAGFGRVTHRAPGRRADRHPRLTLAHAGAAPGLTDLDYLPLLCVVVAGRKRVFVGDRTFDYDPATYLVASAELPASAQVVEGPCLSCVLTLALGTLASLTFDPTSGQDEAEDPAASTRAMAVHALGADLLDPLLRLVRLLDHPADAPVLAPLAEREILYRLMRGPCGPTLRQMVRPDSQLSRVRRAIDVIRRQYNQLLALEGLARVGGDGRDAVPPRLPRGDRDKSPAVPEASAAAGGPQPAAGPRR